jgi:hypothetical protein
MKKLLIAGVVAVAIFEAVWVVKVEMARAELAARLAAALEELQKNRRTAWTAPTSAVAPAPVYKTVDLAAVKGSAAAASRAILPVQRMMDEFIASMNNPEAQQWHMEEQRALISARYAGMFRELGLDPADQAKFKELLLERQMGDSDMLALEFERGLNPLTDLQEYSKLLNESHREVDDKIKSLLGDERYAKALDYEMGKSQRAAVNQLRQALSYTTSPLSAEQGSALTELMQAESPGRTSGLTESVVEKSAAFLNPQQLASLKELQAGEAAKQKLDDFKRSLQTRGGF